jgi:hypothetical protein
VSVARGKRQHRTEVTEATEVWEKSKDNPNSLLVASNPNSSLFIVIVVRFRKRKRPRFASRSKFKLSVSVDSCQVEDGYLEGGNHRMLRKKFEARYSRSPTDN